MFVDSVENKEIFEEVDVLLTPCSNAANFWIDKVVKVSPEYLLKAPDYLEDEDFDEGINHAALVFGVLVLTQIGSGISNILSSRLRRLGGIDLRTPVIRLAQATLLNRKGSDVSTKFEAIEAKIISERKYVLLGANDYRVNPRGYTMTSIGRALKYNLQPYVDGWEVAKVSLPTSLWVMRERMITNYSETPQSRR